MLSCSSRFSLIQKLKLTPPWSSSAWNSAKHWPAKARSSTSPFLLVLPFPSPWTPPGARPHGPRRSPVPRRFGEMPGEEKSSKPRNSKTLQPAQVELQFFCHLLKRSGALRLKVDFRCHQPMCRGRRLFYLNKKERFLQQSQPLHLRLWHHLLLFK